LLAELITWLIAVPVGIWAFAQLCAWILKAGLEPLQGSVERMRDDVRELSHAIREVRDLMPRTEVPWEPHRPVPSGMFDQSRALMVAKPIVLPNSWNLPPGTVTPK
jgi:hypothetical protein